MAEEEKLFLTGDISRMMDVQITEARLIEFGFVAVKKEKRSTFWKAVDYPPMCDKMAAFILTKKTAKRKRQLDMGRMVSKADQKAVMAMLPYA